MSTIVQMPVRVKPPAGRHRRHHFAGLRVLGDRDAAERRSDHGVVEVRSARDPPAASPLPPAGARRVPAAPPAHPRSPSRRPRRTAWRSRPSPAAAGAPGSRGALARRTSSLARGPFGTPCAWAIRRANIAALAARVIKACQHLALLHRHALVHVHFGDLACDLRRHRGAAPRRHVPRRVQHGAAALARARPAVRPPPS